MNVALQSFAVAPPPVPQAMSPPPSEPVVSCSEPMRWFAQEVQPHEAVLKAYLRGAFPAVRDQVEDVVQESYLRIWKARAGQPIRSAKAFLFQIARRLAVDLVRGNRTVSFEAMPDLDASAVIDLGADVAETACKSEEVLLLMEALESLPPRCREIMVLRKFHNLPQKVVAERLGLSELTVQEQVYRGVRRCEKFFLRRGVMRSMSS